MYSESVGSASPSIHFQVGARVSVKGKSGVVRFAGPTQFSTGQWVGIELDQPHGKNDGSVQGIRYFECESQSSNGLYGLFVRPNTIDMSTSSRRLSTPTSTSSSRLSISPQKVFIFQELNCFSF